MAEDFPEPRYAVPELIPEGLTFLAGAPKLGKSWLMLGLSVAVASGGHALGKIEVDQGDVLHLALEDPPRRLQTRLSMMLNGSGPPKGLQFFTEWNRLSEGGDQELGLWLQRNPATRLVVIDIFSRVRPRLVDNRADRFMADYSTGEKIKTVADEYGVAVVALHHTRKLESEDFVDLLSGSHGLAASADTIAVCKRSRGQADATLHVTGRDIEERSLALRFAPEVGTWSLLGDAAEWALSETRRTIIEVLRIHGSLTPKGVADVSDVAHENAKKTLQRMADEGQAVAKSGRYSLPVTPVPGVPLSLDESGGQGQRDSGDRGEE